MFCRKSTRVFRGINVLYRQQQQRGKKSLKDRGKQKKQGKPNIFRVDSKQTIEAKLTNEAEENTGKPVLGQAYQDGSGWYLPAGTMVKHGTTTNNLRQILKYGLLPGNIEGCSGARKHIGTLPITKDAVYVGSCYVAYNISMAKFALNMETLIHSNGITSCRFDNIKKKMMKVMQSVGHEESNLRNDSDLLINKYLNKEKKEIEACGLPVVLNIKLKENVRIHADEDFVPVRFECTSENKDLMALFAEPSWNEHGSAAILQSIPAEWIKTFECFEHNFQYEEIALEKYFVTESLKNDLASNDSNKTHEFIQFMTKEKKKSSLACQNFEYDLSLAFMAQKLYQTKLIDSSQRQRWTDIVKRSKRSTVFSKFGNKIDIEPYLDQLEGDNYIDLLGSGYTIQRELYKYQRNLE